MLARRMLLMMRGRNRGERLLHGATLWIDASRSGSN